MKREKYQQYIYWGVTAFIVLALLVVFVFTMVKFDRVKAGIDMLTGILAPITYGAVLAYLLAPIYNRVRKAVIICAKAGISPQKDWEKLGGFVATLASVFLLIALVMGLISMLIPQLRSSIMGIVEALPASMNNLQIWLDDMLANNQDVEAMVMQYYDEGMTILQGWLTSKFLPNVDKIYGFISNVSVGVINILVLLKNILIGLIVMVYLLNMKEKLLTQFKMILYGVFPLKVANKLLEEGRYVHQVFGGFIIGKLLDSLIIGILSFVLLNFMKMPNVLLVSVIIGVTNVIPFFGPFIGAIPSAFLILLSSPVKCFWFIGFILLLQQFDGNILGPKILGDSTGLSSFWVLFPFCCSADCSDSWV